MTHVLKIVLPLLVLGGAGAEAAARHDFSPVEHQQDWGFRASMSVGGFWGAPRVYARPVTVGAYAECQWVQVQTRFGARWQAVCD